MKHARTRPRAAPSDLVRAGVALLGALALAACDAGVGDDSPVTPLDAPVGVGSAQPSLASGDDGRVFLSWHEPTADSTSVLRMAVLDDTVWSEPVTVAAGRDFIVNWADFPSLLPLGGPRLAAHWLEREGSDTYAYGVRVSLSDDGGRTWTDPVTPHRDGTPTEHGFVAMLPARDGVDVIWLDGRAYAGERQEMSLRAARVGVTGAGAEETLDERVCDCCQTDAAVADSNAVVVYRDRSAGEIRDIAIQARVRGRWSMPRVVHADGWKIDGCPVNGPAVAAHDNVVAVAWFTAANDTPRVQLAFSRDGGAHFGLPFRIDEGQPGGRVDVVMLDERTAVVSWIEEGEPAGSVRLRTVSLDRGIGPARTIADVPAARASGFPRMVPAGAGVVIAWTDVDARRVRVARVAL
ncbi:MAG TPA: hypothetical protein VF039_04025 [Longimicrobiales bacterium]